MLIDWRFYFCSLLFRWKIVLWYYFSAALCCSISPGFHPFKVKNSPLSAGEGLPILQLLVWTLKISSVFLLKIFFLVAASGCTVPWMFSLLLNVVLFLTENEGIGLCLYLVSFNWLEPVQRNPYFRLFFSSWPFFGSWSPNKLILDVGSLSASVGSSRSRSAIVLICEFWGLASSSKVTTKLLSNS